MKDNEISPKEKRAIDLTELAEMIANLGISEGENIEKIFVKKITKYGNGSHIPVPKEFEGFNAKVLIYKKEGVINKEYMR